MENTAALTVSVNIVLFPQFNRKNAKQTTTDNRIVLRKFSMGAKRIVPHYDYNTFQR